MSGSEVPMRVAIPDMPSSRRQDLNDLDTKYDRSRYELQFYKTKQCSFWEKGKCTRGDLCNYAHGNRELSHGPDLTRTSLCRKLENCTDPKCSFAHSPEELRATNKFYKTSLCKFHMVGRCRLGKDCRHAHGEEELQPAPVQSGVPSFAKKVKSGKAEKKPAVKKSPLTTGLEWDRIAWQCEAELWKFNAMTRPTVPVPQESEVSDKLPSLSEDALSLWDQQLLRDVQSLVDERSQPPMQVGGTKLWLEPAFAPTSFDFGDMEKTQGYSYFGSRSTTYQDLPQPELQSQGSSEPEDLFDEAILKCSFSL